MLSLLFLLPAVAMSAETTLVNLPHFELEMMCSYDIRPINITAHFERFYLEFLPPFQELRVQGLPDINGQENTYPPCEYSSSKTFTTASGFGYGYFLGDNITEADILKNVTSDSLYEYFFRNVCQYEIERWKVVVNDPTFATTTNGRDICPSTELPVRAGVIAAIVVSSSILAGVLFYLLYPSCRK